MHLKSPNFSASILFAFVLIFFSAQVTIAGEPKQEVVETQQKKSPSEHVTPKPEQNLKDAIEGNAKIDEARLLAQGINPKTVDFSSIAELESFKLATPDKDANVLGGTLKVRFKPSYKRATIKSTSRFEINQWETTDEPGQYVYLGYKKAFKNIPNHRWAIGVGITYDHDVTNRERIDRRWHNIDPDAPDPLYTVENLSIGAESRDSLRKAISSSFEFELTRHAYFYFNQYHHDSNRDYLENEIDYRYKKDGFSEYSSTSGTVENATIVKQTIDRTYSSKYHSYTVGARHETELWENELQIQLKNNKGLWDNRQDSFFKRTNVFSEFSNADSRYPEFTPDTLSTGAPESFQFDELRILNIESTNDDFIANLDFARRWELDNLTFRIKTGAKLFKQDIAIDDDREIYSSFDGNFDQSEVIHKPSTSSSIFNGRYQLNGFQDSSRLNDHFEANKPNYRFNLAKTRSQSDPSNYTVNAQIEALYLMADAKLRNFRFLTGLRTERTNNEFTGREVYLDEKGNYVETIDTTGDSNYRQFFPGLHLAYSVNQDLTFYASWSKALERPHFQYLAPYRRVSQRNKYISEGNPNLNPTQFTSALLALEYNYHKQGFINIELLQRNYADIVIRKQQIIDDGIFEGYRKDSWINLDEGNLSSVEVRWYQGVDFLSDWLEGVSLEVRYTHNVSETASEDREEIREHEIVDIPENQLETSIRVRRENWDITATYKRRSTFLDRIGVDADRDQYYSPHESLNIGTEYSINSTFTAYLKINNLTSSHT
ncbi:MAG: TonB-dependent receptor, partial [Opitutales bacterium]|nr:TonB-dependent receptor [Opitutales bacterium]